MEIKLTIIFNARLFKVIIITKTNNNLFMFYRDYKFFTQFDIGFTYALTR